MRAVDVQAARTYHDETKHSVERLQREPHFLDWETLPTPYKLYTALDPEPLPHDWPSPTEPAIAAIAGGATASGIADSGTAEARTPTAPDVARLLLLSAGITRHVVYANGRETYFRAAACTGALYHVDLYVVCGALAGLDAGVYHFGPQDFALRRLRDGDHRAVLIAASGEDPAVARAAVIVVLASTVWRNAWKYRARAYRHVFWDGGTLIANALAAAAAAKLPARVVCGFADATVQRLVGVDGERELPFALLAIGDDRGPRPPVPPIAPIAPTVAPASVRETAYPAIPAVHRASNLETAEEVRAWRTRAIGASDHDDAADAAAPRIPLRPLRDVPDEPIDAVIRRRGSTRVFDRTAAIGFEELSTILVTATRPFAADYLADAAAHLCELFLVVHAVDGLAPGTYAHDRRTQTLELLRGGDFRREAGFLALGQELAADASVDCYMLADLTRVLGGLGDRGYRCAQLEGGIVGGRIYLAAYALRLGATGLTFFDDAVVDFFGPRAAGKDVMFLAAIGRGRREHGR